jgi:hypothetical protein
MISRRLSVADRFEMDSPGDVIICSVCWLAQNSLPMS